jgi:Kdo2-lipid IVA lauroyltransferase/acyltransferase
MTAVLDLLAWVASRLPDWFVGPISDVLEFFVFRLCRYRRTIMRENILRAYPGWSPSERENLRVKSARHLARVVVEFLRIPKYLADRDHFLVLEGEAEFERARSQGRGVLVLSGHLGSFEVGLGLFAEHFTQVSVVVKAFPKSVDAFLTRHRTRSGLQILHARGSARGILRALAEGRAVVFVLDQNSTATNGVFVDFFGMPACTVSALAALSIRTGAPVVPVFSKRLPDGRHQVHIEPELALEPSGDRQADIVQRTALYTRTIEAAIRRCPEQWFWTHRRWKTQPTDATGS